MQRPPDLTDRDALIRNRQRASALDDTAMFLQDEAALEVQERLSLVNRSFTSPAVVTGWPDFWQSRLPDAHIVEDSDTLDLQPGAHDLLIHFMALHWANDPVGQLIQARRALKPDGLFLAVLFGGQTLVELRAALAEAEVGLTGGLSPRVAPMAEIRDLGALLQRAGFALPVADSVSHTVTYASAGDLMRDLRAMGETNAMAARTRHLTRKSIFTECTRHYAYTYALPDGRLPATFEMIFLTGWAPHSSQPKALKPGSATARLSDVLGVDETPMGVPTLPQRD